MEMLLVAALTLGAVAAIWFLSQLGFVWVVVGLGICLFSLVVIFLKKRMVHKDEHLYDAPPTISSIRQPVSPMDYSYRSNLDVPFFSFESKNYGKKTPRRRVRGIPIDRFLEFQEKVDTLSASLTDLLERLKNAQAAESQTNQATGEKVIFVYGPGPQTDAKQSNSSTITEPKYTDPKPSSKLWRRKGQDHSDRIVASRDRPLLKPQPEPNISVNLEPEKPRRFRKSRAGDPWDSASHWGWRN